MNDTLYILKEAKVYLGNSQQTLTTSFNYPTLLLADQHVEIFLASKQMNLPKGRMLFIQSNHSVTLILDVKLPTEIVSISFVCYQLLEDEGQRLVYNLDNKCLPENAWISNDVPLRIYAMMHEIISLYEQQKERRYNYLLAELVDAIFSKNILPENDKDVVLMEVLCYIQDNYQKPLTRSAIAQMIGFNSSYFSTMFREKIGLGFSEYLNRIRLEKAKEYLLTTDLSQHDIAMKVGYSNGLYLNRKFKQMNGITPGEFRSRPKPKRIVAFQFVGHLLALGMKPVAIDSLLSNNSMLLKSELQQVKIIDFQHNLQRLQELKVDLILAPTYYYNIPGRIQKLESITDVITLDWGKMDCLEEAKLLGKILGKEREAQQWIEHYLKKVQHFKKLVAKHISSDETVALYELRDNRIGIWNRTIRGVYNLYDMLHLTPPKRVKTEVLRTGNHLIIQESLLPEYAADHMFVVIGGEDYQEELTRHIERNPAWLDLTAVKRNQVYPLSLEEFWSSDGLSLERQLDKQVEYLLKGHKTNIYP